MPLLLRPDGVSSGAVSQEMSSMQESQWQADTIQELKALDLKGQRMQHAVIGQLQFFSTCTAPWIGLSVIQSRAACKRSSLLQPAQFRPIGGCACYAT